MQLLFASPILRNAIDNMHSCSVYMLTMLS